MLVLLAVAGLAIRSGVQDQLTDATDSQLETRASAVARLLVERGGPEVGLTAGLDDPGESFTQILDAGGRVALASDGLPSAPLLTADEIDDASEGVTITLEGVQVEAEAPSDEEIDRGALQETTPEPFEDDRARVIARTVDVGGERLTVIVGDTFEDRSDAMGALQQVLLIALPLSLLAACLVGWFAIGAALRPVERMRRQASGISERSLDDRLELPEARDELRALAETLNAMLGRLAAAIDRERAFASDASHELRTPLAVLTTELELATRGDRSAQELRDAITSALEEARHLTSLADGLLVLARADHGHLAAGTERVDLVALAERVAERLGLDAAFGAGAEEAARPAAVIVHGDGLRLEQAIANLVENAQRHGAAPVEITVSRPSPLTAQVLVADRGAGVPEDFLPVAFERFARADVARTTAGTGLGLSIARAVAQAHGGDVVLEARPGGGTLARLTVLSSAPA